MDNIFEKRFEYLNAKSKEELLKELTETRENLIYMEELLKDRTTSYSEKSEIKNIDRPYEQNKERYILKLLGENE